MIQESLPSLLVNVGKRNESKRERCENNLIFILGVAMTVLQDLF